MKIPKTVDSIIVGAGLTGLKLFHELKNRGENALLIEKSNDIGGSLTQFFTENDSLSLSSIVWTTSDAEAKETVTLGKKGLIPFMGFGDKKIPTLDIINTFLKPESHVIDAEFLAESLELKPNFESSRILTHTQITKFLRNSPTDSKAFQDFSFCELNGKDTVEFKNIYWTAPIQDFCDVLPKEEFSELKQKVKKAKSFDGLSIQFEVEPEVISEDIQVLENKKIIILGEEDHPWIGALIKSKTNNENLSLTFTTFYDWSLSQDHDFIRKHLKSLKRQVRKIAPELYSEEHINAFSDDKITLHGSVASNLKLTDKMGKVKGLNNFFFLNSHKDFYPDPLESKLSFIKKVIKNATPLEEQHIQTPEI